MRMKRSIRRNITRRMRRGRRGGGINGKYTPVHTIHIV